MAVKQIKGDLIQLAKEGKFDVIIHGCNCFCKQEKGLAKDMNEAFGTNNMNWYPLESRTEIGNINKLGQIEYYKNNFTKYNKPLIVVNAYTQYKYGTEKGVVYADYDAIRLCMRKINHTFAGKTIGIPKIGAGLAGGNWKKIRQIILKELTSCEVVLVKKKT